MTFLALKLIQHVIALASFLALKLIQLVIAIEYRLIFAINLVNFQALKLIQHVIAIRSIRNLDTGSYLP